MSTKQSLISEIESLPANIIDEVYQYVSFLKFKQNSITDNATATGVKPSVESREPFFGCMKGKVWMSDDFDAPLDDFKGYM